MKKKMMKSIVALFALAAVLSGCNDDDGGGTAGLPQQQTIAAFKEQFPQATNVTWSKKKGYDVATFALPTRATAAQPRNSAWYPEGGTAYSYTQIELTWEQLQAEAPAVAAAWSSSAYKTAGYTLDDIDKKSYSGAETTYKLEIEQGKTERELVYGRDGTLLSDRLDIDEDDDDTEDDPCPQEVLDFVTANLPGALIVESDTEEENGTVTYEVEVRYRINGRQTEADLIFDARYAFLCAVTEIDDEDYTNPAILPAAVYAKFTELAGDNEIDEVVKLYATIADFKAGTNARYAMTVEDEETDRETTYVVDAAGNPVE